MQFVSSYATRAAARARRQSGEASFYKFLYNGWWTSRALSTLTRYDSVNQCANTKIRNFALTTTQQNLAVGRAGR